MTNIKIIDGQMEVYHFIERINNLAIEKLGHPIQAVGEKPAIRDPELRANLIEEEAKECADALRAGDLVKAVDGMADTLVVVFGAAVACGVNLGPIFEEVMRANMTKIRPGADFRADGKLLKAPDFQEPNIASELRKQGWKDWEGG